MIEEQKNKMSFPLLDSKLIVATMKELYNVKIVNCGDYAQVYYYKDSKVRNKCKKDNDDLKLKKNNITDYLKDNKAIKDNSLKEIELKNIIRSKLECQRLAKTNIEDWETFITLTFEENIQDVEIANKRFKYFIDKVRRVKKDFKYLCITEFQKRGATHYHMLCNISINDEKLMYTQEDNKEFKHVKYWIDGFSSVQEIKDNPKMIIGYIAKYMTKDIDERLYNRHRYFYSRNLNKPKADFLNLENEKDLEFYKKIIQDKQLIYQNEYLNPYDNSQVEYLEFMKNNN